MPDPLPIEELVIDDSFHNYCLGTNEADILFWQAYITAHPHEKAKIGEAREMVLALHIMLQQECGVSERVELHNAPVLPLHRTPRRKKVVRYAAAAAAIVFMAWIGRQYANGHMGKWLASPVTARVDTNKTIWVTTAKGQKRTLWLPDSTQVVLNSGSTLRTDNGFGADNRTVYLSGEALFDVTHNEHLPFIVHVDDYDIKVLGTRFNVKAYPGEKISETALLRGKVQILKKDGGDLTLVPNQKVVFKHMAKPETPTNANTSTPTETIQKIMPVHFNRKDSVVVETAWAQNRLEIVNERFADMKEKLERWYNVEIHFEDMEVARYTFTATFEKETIGQVLQALQYAYPFTYRIQGHEVTISK